MATKLLLLFIFNIIFIILTNGERTKDKMYESIGGSAACFRRLNGTHQTGCTSKRPSSVGVVHIVTDLETDINFVLKDGLAPPYIPVLSIDYFTPDLVDKLSQHPSRLAGVVLHTNVSRPNQLSHESSCPNSRSNLDGSCPSSRPWNPWGTGLLHADIPFAVFALRNESELAKIEACWRKFNSHKVSEQPLRSLCSLELGAFMFATRDSQTCIRRSASVTTFTPTRFCDPLGSRNAWATLWPRYNGTTNMDVMLVTARMDATSMFYDVTPGADTHLTGLVTLLATAYTMKHMVKQNEEYKKNIMFVMFNGEGYDYIGSQRFVYDVMNPGDPTDPNNIMNLTIGDIKLVVELNQLNPNPNNNIYLHHVQQKQSKNEMEEFMKNFISEAKNYNLNVKETQASENILPPASLHSFLRERPSIQGVVLTDHESEYKNQYYHSIYDDSDNIGYMYYNSTEGGNVPEGSLQQRIVNMSAALAKVLYSQATGKTFTGEINLDVSVDTIVDEILHCFLDTAHCKLFQALTHKDHLSETPFPSYVSVDTNTHKLTSLTGYTLAWLMSDEVNRTQEECSGDPNHPSVYQYIWVSNNLTNITSKTCLRSTMHFSLALSPAFTIENYDWTSNKYSTWTESVWSDIYMRMFLTPSNRHEIMTISVGTVTFVLSLALVYFVHTRADILFAKPDAIAPGTSC